MLENLYFEQKKECEDLRLREQEWKGQIALWKQKAESALETAEKGRQLGKERETKLKEQVKDMENEIQKLVEESEQKISTHQRALQQEQISNQRRLKFEEDKQVQLKEELENAKQGKQDVTIIQLQEKIIELQQQLENEKQQRGQIQMVREKKQQELEKISEKYMKMQSRLEECLRREREADQKKKDAQEDIKGIYKLRDEERRQRMQLEEEKIRDTQKIEQLENQIDNLFKDNHILRESINQKDQKSDQEKEKQREMIAHLQFKLQENLELITSMINEKERNVQKEQLAQEKKNIFSNKNNKNVFIEQKVILMSEELLQSKSECSKLKEKVADQHNTISKQQEEQKALQQEFKEWKENNLLQMDQHYIFTSKANQEIMKETINRVKEEYSTKYRSMKLQRDEMSDVAYKLKGKIMQLENTLERYEKWESIFEENQTMKKQLHALKESDKIKCKAIDLLREQVQNNQSSQNLSALAHFNHMRAQERNQQMQNEAEFEEDDDNQNPSMANQSDLKLNFKKKIISLYDHISSDSYQFIHGNNHS